MALSTYERNNQTLKKTLNLQDFHLDVEEEIELEKEIHWLQVELEKLRTHLSTLESTPKVSSNDIRADLDEKKCDEELTESDLHRSFVMTALQGELEQELMATLHCRNLQKRTNDELEASLSQNLEEVLARERKLRMSSIPRDDVSNPKHLRRGSFNVISEHGENFQRMPATRSVSEMFSTLKNVTKYSLTNSIQLRKKSDKPAGKLTPKIFSFRKRRVHDPNAEPSCNLFFGDAVYLSIELTTTMIEIYRRHTQSHPSITEDGQCKPKSWWPSSPFTSLKHLNSSKGRSRTCPASSSASPSREKAQNCPDFYKVHDDTSKGEVGPYADCSVVDRPPKLKHTLNSMDSQLMNRYRSLAGQLAYVNTAELSHEEKLAFWINLYNAIVMHAIITFGFPNSQYKRMVLMHKVSYDVGGYTYSASSIEHSVLRACSSRPLFFQTGILPAQRFKEDDPRFLNSLERSEPLVTFALCNGTRSSPALRVYSSEKVYYQLKEATLEYLHAAVSVKNHKIFIPKLLAWYGKDFASDDLGLLQWLIERLPFTQAHSLLELLPRKRSSATKRICVTPYDWNFRYLIRDGIF